MRDRKKMRAFFAFDPEGVGAFVPPLPIPVPGVRLYWHSRNDGDPAHRWMRGKVLSIVDALGYRDFGG